MLGTASQKNCSVVNFSEKAGFLLEKFMIAPYSKAKLSANIENQGKFIMENLAEKITARLEELRCHLQADGGDLEIISIEGKTVQLKLRGACGCCPHATMTIKNGLERILRDEIDPEITIERVM